MHFYMQSIIHCLDNGSVQFLSQTQTMQKYKIIKMLNPPKSTFSIKNEGQVQPAIILLHIRQKVCYLTKPRASFI